MRLVLLAIFSPLLLSGCAVVGPVIGKYNVTDVTPSDAYECSSTNMAAPCEFETVRPIEAPSVVIMCPSKKVGVLTSCEQEEARTLTMEKLVSVWGEPKRRGKKDGLEYLTYNKSIAWRGFFGIFFIIPLPFVVPVRHNETILFFKNGKLTRTMVEYGNWEAGFHVLR